MLGEPFELERGGLQTLPSDMQKAVQDFLDGFERDYRKAIAERELKPTDTGSVT